MMISYYDRTRGGLLASKWETSTDPGRGLVARITDDYELQFPVVGENLPWPAARDVVASQVGAVRPLETVDQRIMAVGDGFRLPCSNSDDSDDDVLSVGPVRPLSTAASLGGEGMDDDCRLQADSLNVVSGGLGRREPQ